MMLSRDRFVPICGGSVASICLIRIPGLLILVSPTLRDLELKIEMAKYSADNVALNGLFLLLQPTLPARRVHTLRIPHNANLCMREEHLADPLDGYLFFPLKQLRALKHLEFSDAGTAVTHLSCLRWKTCACTRCTSALKGIDASISPDDHKGFHEMLCELHLRGVPSAVVLFVDCIAAPSLESLVLTFRNVRSISTSQVAPHFERIASRVSSSLSRLTLILSDNHRSDCTVQREGAYRAAASESPLFEDHHQLRPRSPHLDPRRCGAAYAAWPRLVTFRLEQAYMQSSIIVPSSAPPLQDVIDFARRHPRLWHLQ
ncbi:hypothetical protein BD414DRAFT_148886 [Trametes punicea]|nr:hypothetical protein BD414DRAFT_148886 [Trametes punicea]